MMRLSWSCQISRLSTGFVDKHKTRVGYSNQCSANQKMLILQSVIYQGNSHTRVCLRHLLLSVSHPSWPGYRWINTTFHNNWSKPRQNTSDRHKIISNTLVWFACSGARCGELISFEGLLTGSRSMLLACLWFSAMTSSFMSNCWQSVLIRSFTLWR